jgi:hypothetical protein
MSEPLRVKTVTGKVIEVRDAIPYEDGTVDIKGWDEEGNFRHYIHRDIAWEEDLLARAKEGI